jgi:hypothetical protein
MAAETCGYRPVDRRSRLDFDKAGHVPTSVSVEAQGNPTQLIPAIGPRNGEGQTVAAPYCLRPYPGATVSAPLEWKEVGKGLRPSQFTLKTIFPRLQKKGDLMQGLLDRGADLEKAAALLARR